MNSPARFISYLWFSCFLLLYFSFPVVGQKEMKYQGILQAGTYRGIAEYSFHIAQEDTVLSGDFSIQSTGLNVLQSKDKEYFSIKGSFNAGLPEKTWRFRFGDFEAEEGVDLENYHIKVKVSGLQHTAVVNYDRGKPDGEWINSIRKIKNSEVEKTTFVSSSQFEDGIAQGYLRIKNERLSMLGRFLRTGLAHDTWELNFNKEIGRLEKWQFSNGRLEKILIINDNETSKELLVYPDEIQQLKTVNLDHRYLKILAIQNKFDSLLYADSGGKMTELIKENASYYNKIKSIMLNLQGSDAPSSQPSFLVKVAHFPPDEQQLEQVSKLKNQVQAIDTISHKLMSNTRLNILKHSDEEVLYLLSTLDEITSNYILPAKRLVSYHEEDLLAYVPIEKLHWPKQKQSETNLEIKVNFQDSSGLKTRIFKGPAPDDFNMQKTGISYLLDLSEYALNSVNAIKKKLRGKVKQYNVQKELEDLEKILLQEEDSLIDLIDSLTTALSEDQVNQSLHSLKNTAIKAVTQYATSDNLKTKPENVRQLITCMNSLKTLAINLSKNPARLEEIRKQYTEQVWNPFTATIMSDQVKERLTQAYARVLVPYIHYQIEHELTCDNTDKFASLLNVLYEKMLALRKQDTAKLERKLKNEDDPQVVLQLFELAM